jgi:hypothetical protein
MSRYYGNYSQYLGAQRCCDLRGQGPQGEQGPTGPVSIGAVGNIAGSVISKSDKRLKKNINKLGVSPSGINIYSFEYIDNKNGSGVWQGVLSNEVPSIAVVKHEDGYDMVNYSLIDVEFKQL